jgi:hypothetical protein
MDTPLAASSQRANRARLVPSKPATWPVQRLPTTDPIPGRSAPRELRGGRQSWAPKSHPSARPSAAKKYAGRLSVTQTERTPNRSSSICA